MFKIFKKVDEMYNVLFPGIMGEKVNKIKELTDTVNDLRKHVVLLKQYLNVQEENKMIEGWDEGPKLVKITKKNK